MALDQSTSHGHIGVSGDDPEYRAHKLNTKVSETNPRSLNRGETKTSTMVYKSQSFTVPSGYTKVNDDELIVYGGLVFYGDLPRTIGD